MPKSPNILGIIPARGGSRSVPHKNIASLLGKPLIYYTIRAAKESKLLEAAIVSTDDLKIAGVAKKFGADVPFLRPKKYAREDSPDIDFYKHALLWLKKHRSWEPEIILNLRPTSPLRDANDIDRCIKIMLKTDCDSIKTACPVYQHPMKMWRITDEEYFDAEPYHKEAYLNGFHDIPRQKLEKVYWQDAMIDVTYSRFILEENKVFGPHIHVVETDPRKVVDLDTPEDFIVAGVIMKKLQKENEK